MRAILQRVSSASVTIEGRVAGAIERGLLVLLGVAQDDTAADGEWLAQKIAALRIFEDDAGKMNRSLRDLADAEQRTVNREPRTENREPKTVNREPTTVNHEPRTENPSALRPLALVVSQFTLFASTRKGTRPSFNDAAKPDLAIPLYEKFLAQLATALGRPVARGEFGAMMSVALVNDGPVTLIVDTKQRE